MGQSFEEQFDAVVENLKKKNSYSVLVAYFCEWYRTNNAFFANKEDKTFLQQDATKIQFSGMLLKHVLKLFHLQARKPQSNVMNGKPEIEYSYIEVSELTTRLFLPNVSYTEQEMLKLIQDNDIELALEFINTDDLVLKNLVQSLITKRYKQKKKKDLDAIEYVWLDFDGREYSSEALFLAIDQQIEPALREATDIRMLKMRQ